MKKIENINLGGHPFTIDQDAYKELHAYLNNIARMLRKKRMKSELLDDIEYRISELITEELGEKSIVTLAHVESAKKVMGDPRVFLGGSDHSTSHDHGHKTHKSSGKRTRRKKRLMRDESDKVFGGVASGVAAYFGIQEAWIMRLVFLLSFFTIGVNVLLYVILWAVIPAAETEEDYAAMRGEEINFDDIAESVKSEFEDLTKSF